MRVHTLSLAADEGAETANSQSPPQGESDKLVFIKEIINEPSLTGQAKPLPRDF